MMASSTERLPVRVERAAAMPFMESTLTSVVEPPMMTKELIATLAACKNFLPHFHICLQSGCDTVLRDMNRHYTTAEYAQIIQHLRAVFPHGTFATDLIVGFPTETDEYFQTTLAYLKTLRLDKIHVFPYSPRAGTPAAKMKPVPNAVVTERFKNIHFTLFQKCDKY